MLFFSFIVKLRIHINYVYNRDWSKNTFASVQTDIAASSLLWVEAWSVFVHLAISAYIVWYIRFVLIQESKIKRPFPSESQNSLKFLRSEYHSKYKVVNSWTLIMQISIFSKTRLRIIVSVTTNGLQLMRSQTLSI